jgi:hypothetical protein
MGERTAESGLREADSCTNRCKWIPDITVSRIPYRPTYICPTGPQTGSINPYPIENCAGTVDHRFNCRRFPCQSDAYQQGSNWNNAVSFSKRGDIPSQSRLGKIAISGRHIGAIEVSSHSITCNRSLITKPIQMWLSPITRGISAFRTVSASL